MVEVQAALDGLLAGQKSAYERLGDLADRIATDRQLALALEARLAGLAAHDHALLATNQPTDRTVWTDVVTVLERTKVRTWNSNKRSRTVSVTSFCDCQGYGVAFPQPFAMGKPGRNATSGHATTRAIPRIVTPATTIARRRRPTVKARAIVTA